MIFQCIITIWASSIDGLRPWSKRRFCTFCATWKQELLLVQLEQNRTRICKCQRGLPVGCIEFVASLVRIWFSHPSESLSSSSLHLIYPNVQVFWCCEILKIFPSSGGIPWKTKTWGGPASHFSPHASYQCRFCRILAFLCNVLHCPPLAYLLYTCIMWAITFKSKWKNNTAYGWIRRSLPKSSRCSKHKTHQNATRWLTNSTSTETFAEISWNIHPFDVHISHHLTMYQKPCLWILYNF